MFCTSICHRCGLDSFQLGLCVNFTLVIGRLYACYTRTCIYQRKYNIQKCVLFSSEVPYTDWRFPHFLSGSQYHWLSTWLHLLINALETHLLTSTVPSTPHPGGSRQNRTKTKWRGVTCRTHPISSWGPARRLSSQDLSVCHLFLQTEQNTWPHWKNKPYHNFKSKSSPKPMVTKISDTICHH